MSRVLCEPVGGNEARTLSNALKASSRKSSLLMYHGLCYPYGVRIIDSPQMPPARAPCLIEQHLALCVNGQPRFTTSWPCRALLAPFNFLLVAVSGKAVGGRRRTGVVPGSLLRRRPVDFYWVTPYSFGESWGFTTWYGALSRILGLCHWLAQVLPSCC